MPPYRIIQVIFYTLWILLFTGWMLWDWPVWYFIFSLVAYFLIIAWGSYHMRLNFFMKILHHGNRHEPKIAITFDDGPSPETTPSVLDVLKKYGAKATFFCIGKHIINHPELLSRIKAEGHVIGNHSFTHTPFLDISRTRKVIADIQKTSDVIHSITGKQPKLFRPPFGITNPPIARAVSRLGLKVIGWDIRSYDTMNKPPAEVVENVLSKLQNGSVVLLHDNRKETPQILERILQHAQQHHFKSVNIGELLDIECYE